jgi:NitT/TauT family transport system ATP-binding protein
MAPDTAIAPAPLTTPAAPLNGRAIAPIAAVRLDGVTKVYGSGKASVAALDALTLDVEKGSFTCIVGASGCGKTTVLNLIAGLDEPSAGTIEVTGRSALMFQESALFPWLTAAGNVELALRLRGVRKSKRRARALELLDLVHLGGFASKRPHELSGGMRQRVALARALAQDADVLLMDEPFGALDAITRDLLHEELEGVWHQTGLTIVFVTHNVREAARLGDRIVLLASRPGRLAADFDVDLPRPRRIEDSGVTTLATKVTEQLRREVARHGRGA